MRFEVKSLGNGPVLDTIKIIAEAHDIKRRVLVLHSFGGRDAETAPRKSRELIARNGPSAVDPVGKKEVIHGVRIRSRGPRSQGLLEWNTSSCGHDAICLRHVSPLGRVNFVVVVPENQAALLKGAVDSVTGVVEHPQVLKGYFIPVASSQPPIKIDLLAQVFVDEL